MFNNMTEINEIEFNWKWINKVFILNIGDFNMCISPCWTEILTSSLHSILANINTINVFICRFKPFNKFTIPTTNI
jgi:hypothetical protein